MTWETSTAICNKKLWPSCLIMMIARILQKWTYLLAFSCFFSVVFLIIFLGGGKLNISGVDKFELFSYRSSCWQPMFRSIRLKYVWLSDRAAPFTHRKNKLKNKGGKQNYVELSRKSKNRVYFFFNNRLSSGPRA